MYLGTTQDTARGFDYRELPNVIGNFYNAALQARAQTAIQNENIRRIRAGRETVNPSDAVNVTPPMRVQVEPGPDVSALKLKQQEMSPKSRRKAVDGLHESAFQPFSTNWL